MRELKLVTLNSKSQCTFCLAELARGAEVYRDASTRTVVCLNCDGTFSASAQELDGAPSASFEDPMRRAPVEGLRAKKSKSSVKSAVVPLPPDHAKLGRVDRERIIEEGRSPAGGWTKAQAEEWGVPWPLPKGWKKQIVDRGFPYSSLTERQVEGWTKPDAKESERLKLAREKRAEDIKIRAQKPPPDPNKTDFATNKRLVESGETFRSQKASDYKRKGRRE